ncbi:MAG: hypothetical protein HDT28_06610 [Clostridiales bacterium]|nr:hypothetical protein [Clostridiales bacterium]
MGEVAERISRMIENDEFGNVKRTLRVAQSDVMALLNQFMQVEKLDLSVDKNENGYLLKITAEVSRIYDVGKTSEVN